MTSRYRHRRTPTPTQTFAILEPGEIAVNTATRQLTVGDADGGSLGTPLALLGLRIFDARSVYAANDYVVFQGVIFRAKAAITTPGDFNTVQWDAIAGNTGTYVLRSGDNMTGPLTLPLGAPASAHAVRRDYVEGVLANYATTAYVTSAIAPLATKGYTDIQDAKALQLTGGTMVGPLTLAGAPTTGLHASTKAYVDTQVAQSVGVPTGAVMDFAMTAAPIGWLVCDGQAISRVDYAQLFAAVGTIWGSGDGTTTFNVPNFRTRYRRHRDDNVNYASVVGTYQSPLNLTHTHSFNVNSGYHSADHAHYVSGTSGVNDRPMNHSHGGVPDVTVITSGGYVAAAGNNYVTQGKHQTDNALATDHLHSFGAWSGGVNTNHYHNVAGTTGGGSADSAYELRPYSATVLTCIKT